jgi:hypothetical protein
MKLIIPALAIVAFAGDGIELKTEYSADRALRIETDSTFRMETVDMSITVDGEEREGFGAGATSSQTRRIVQVDRVLAAEGGAPTKLQRSFEVLSSSGTPSFGDQEQEIEQECPLSETVLELEVDDGEVIAKVAEGGSLDDALLEGHHLELALAALLPDGEFAEGDEYEIESAALIRALEADMDAMHFPRPPREERGDRGRGDRAVQGGQGGRGRGMRGQGTGLAQLLQAGDWNVQGTLEALEGEFDGTPCVVISIEVTGDGELAEPERGEGGGRGGRGGRALSTSTLLLPVLATNFDLQAEGKLYYSIESLRPLTLELEGEVSIESERIRSRGDSEMVMTSSQEGEFTHRVVIRELEDESAE